MVAHSDGREIELLERDGLGSDTQLARKKGFAFVAIAVNVVARHCHELEGLLRSSHSRKKRTARKFGDHRPLGSRVPRRSSLASKGLDVRSVGLWSAAEHGRSSNGRGCTGVDRLPGRYWSIPPSTSTMVSSPSLSMRFAISSIFESWPEMNFWPPKPGLTLMIKIRSS